MIVIIHSNFIHSNHYCNILQITTRYNSLMLHTFVSTSKSPKNLIFSYYFTLPPFSARFVLVMFEMHCHWQIAYRTPTHPYDVAA